MAYVQIPKDLSTVKSKIAFNLTKRQIICFALAAVIGVPAYIFTKDIVGNQPAVLLMICLMLPFFFTAMYQKDGQPAEKVIKQYIRAKYVFPLKRKYKTQNLYSYLTKEGETAADEKPEYRK